MSKQFLLIVEKDDEIRTQLKDELGELLKMVIVPASDGVQAYQKARNQRFDVVICEPEVGKISGRQLYDALREKEHNHNLPILVYAKDLIKAKVSAKNLRSIEFMEKPQDYEKIAKKLTALTALDPDKKQFKIDVDFINPFIDSAVNTLNEICGVNDIKSLKPYLLADEVLDIDISGTLQISSPFFKGSIAVSFSDQVYKNIITKMLEKKVEGIDTENQDGAAEIINIIFGQTKAVLNKRGYSLERAVPSVLRGKGHKLQGSLETPVLLVPFNSDTDRFWIQICVKAI